jgi:hypothetical protein
MKYAIILLAFVGCISICSCSKKGAAGPVPHNIKVTVTATAAFTVTLSAIKADETVSSAIDTKSVTTGSYEFTTGLVAGGVLHMEIQNSGTGNTVSYVITNNSTTVAQESAKELGSFSKISTDYTVN